MKLYVDDVREAPEGWAYARSFEVACAALQADALDCEAISLDHDLGMGNDGYPARDGYDIAKFMVEKNIWPKRIYVHSMNPVGRHNIMHLLNHYKPADVLIYPHGPGEEPWR